MAPFRSSGRNNRSGRINNDNDPFEGLPVRQWRQSEGTFGLPPPEAVVQDNNCVYPELPMPKDSHLLSEFTQRILREARKPRFAKRKAEQTEEEKVEDDEETKDRPVQVGWAAKKWSQTPRHAEEPDREYLAKRRKGLTSTYVEAPVMVPQVATRTAKVRKLDAAGNATVYDVIVAEGQTVEGEVKDEDVSMIDAPTLAPGTVIEGIGVANAEGQVVANDLLAPTPQKRRKPPPPKRKGGPGRGKKKVMFQPAPANGDAAAPANGAAPAAPTNGTDTPTSAPAGSEQDGGQVDGDEDDGEEGEEGEDGDEDGDDREDGEASGDETPAAQPSAPASTQASAPVSAQDTPTAAPLSEAGPPLPSVLAPVPELPAAVPSAPEIAVPEISTAPPLTQPLEPGLEQADVLMPEVMDEPSIAAAPLPAEATVAPTTEAPAEAITAVADVPLTEPVPVPAGTSESAPAPAPAPEPEPVLPSEPLPPADTAMPDAPDVPAPAPAPAPEQEPAPAPEPSSVPLDPPAPVLAPPPPRSASSSPDLPLAGGPTEQVPPVPAPTMEPEVRDA
ncbi:Hypothetical protein D9617_22g066760 [Elsinoe fawcettii]|nr:Hypothetical protein D9617_22g066760 [Elsinoe fawcettii]